METTDKSTPSNTEVTDTSSDDVLLRDASASEPQKYALEPENALDEADVTDEPAEDNELIFGKFKTMEEARKGYKEAERAITKAADLEKQLEQYKYLSENFEKDAIARRQGYADRFDMALTSDVHKHELDNYALAAGYTLSPQEQLKVSELISRCRNGGNDADFADLRRCFSPEVVALASEDATLYKNSRLGEYNAIRAEEKDIRYKRKISEFRNNNGQWVDSPLKEELIKQAMDVTDGKVDLFMLKELADAVAAEAVKKYQADNDMKHQNSAAQDGLQTPLNNNARVKTKKWLTKKEYYALSPEEEAEKYDLIVEQVLLEKQGKLPRMLTK